MSKQHFDNDVNCICHSSFIVPLRYCDDEIGVVRPIHVCTVTGTIIIQ
jgi:hypothetical protein